MSSIHTHICLIFIKLHLTTYKSKQAVSYIQFCPLHAFDRTVTIICIIEFSMLNYPRETWAALNERVFTDSASQGPAPRHRSLGLWCWIKGYSNFLFTALLFFIDLGSHVLYMNNWFDHMKYMAEEIRKWFILSIISSYCTYWFLFLVKYLEYLFWNINIAYPHTSFIFVSGVKWFPTQLLISSATFTCFYS